MPADMHLYFGARVSNRGHACISTGHMGLQGLLLASTASARGAPAACSSPATGTPTHRGKREKIQPKAPGTLGACEAAGGEHRPLPTLYSHVSQSCGCLHQAGLGCPKPETRNLKPKTQNPKPEALSPELQVFRTYNASIVLDELLWKAADESETPDEKKADYDRANKEVGLIAQPSPNNYWCRTSRPYRPQ